MLGIKAKALKDALKDVPDDYVVRLDAQEGSIAVPDGYDCFGRTYNRGSYQLDTRLSEVKGVSVDNDMNEVVLDVDINLEETNG